MRYRVYTPHIAKTVLADGDVRKVYHCQVKEMCVHVSQYSSQVPRYTMAASCSRPSHVALVADSSPGINRCAGRRNAAGANTPLARCCWVPAGSITRSFVSSATLFSCLRVAYRRRSKAHCAIRKQWEVKAESGSGRGAGQGWGIGRYLTLPSLAVIATIATTAMTTSTTSGRT